MVAKLSADLQAVLAQPDVREALARQGAEATPGTPDAFAAQIRSELAVRARVVKDASIKLDCLASEGSRVYPDGTRPALHSGTSADSRRGKRRNAVLMATNGGAVAVAADGPMTVVDVVRQIPLEELEMRMVRFRDRVPAEDLRYALVQRIGSAPLDQFNHLQSIYLNHFSD